MASRADRWGRAIERWAIRERLPPGRIILLRALAEAAGRGEVSALPLLRSELDRWAPSEGQVAQPGISPPENLAIPTGYRQKLTAAGNLDSGEVTRARARPELGAGGQGLPGWDIRAHGGPAAPESYTAPQPADDTGRPAGPLFVWPESLLGGGEDRPAGRPVRPDDELQPDDERPTEAERLRPWEQAPVLDFSKAPYGVRPDRKKRGNPAGLTSEDLKAWMRVWCLSGKTAARILGYSEGTISSWCQRREWPLPYGVAGRLSMVLPLHIDDVVNRNPDGPENWVRVGLFTTSKPGASADAHNHGLDVRELEFDRWWSRDQQRWMELAHRVADGGSLTRMEAGEKRWYEKNRQLDRPAGCTVRHGPTGRQMHYDKKNEFRQNRFWAMAKLARRLLDEGCGARVDPRWARQGAVGFSPRDMEHVPFSGQASAVPEGAPGVRPLPSRPGHPDGDDSGP